MFVSLAGGKLLTRLGAEDKDGFQLFYQGDHTFIPAIDSNLRVRFVLESDRVVSFKVMENGEVGMEAKRVR